MKLCGMKPERRRVDSDRNCRSISQSVINSQSEPQSSVVLDLTSSFMTEKSIGAEGSGRPAPEWQVVEGFIPGSVWWTETTESGTVITSCSHTLSAVRTSDGTDVDVRHRGRDLILFTWVKLSIIIWACLWYCQRPSSCFSSNILMLVTHSGMDTYPNEDLVFASIPDGGGGT